MTRVRILLKNPVYKDLIFFNTSAEASLQRNHLLRPAIDRMAQAQHFTYDPRAISSALPGRQNTLIDIPFDSLTYLVM